MTNKMEETKNIYKELSKIKLKIKKKGRFDYASWAECWQEVKKLYPKANYEVIPFKSKTVKEGVLVETEKLIHPISKEGGGFVKVQVTINELTHIEYYPILNNMNKPIKYDFITAFDVNSSIKRGLVKCLALFGLGLHIFNGEEFNEENN